MSEHLSKTTTDHDEIREWAEARGAKPACVRGTGAKGDVGLLRLDFPGYTGENKLEHISWDEFFEKFDESNLALVYQEHTADGQQSNFNKLVSRETAADKDHKSHTSGSKGSGGHGSSSHGSTSHSSSRKAGGSKSSGKTKRAGGH